MRSCASSREAMRLVYRSAASNPPACASKTAAASCQKVASRAPSPGPAGTPCRPSRAPAARSAQRSLMRARAPGLGSRMSASTSVSIAPRASSSAPRGCAEASGGSSSHCQSVFHRSAGWMRSAPASCCAARYCGNSISGDTGLPASWRPRKSSSAKDRALDRLHRRGIDQRRPRHHALHRGFAGAQHDGRRRQADEFERAHALVQLRARAAQHGQVDGVDVRAARRPRTP